MAFIALDLSLRLVASLRPIVACIATRDAELADQIRRAATSISLNLGEGRKRTGRDRLHLWRVADGSNEELRTALRVADAWGYLENAELSPSLHLCDELSAMLWKLTH